MSKLSKDDLEQQREAVLTWPLTPEGCFNAIFATLQNVGYDDREFLHAAIRHYGDLRVTRFRQRLYPETLNGIP